MFAQTLTLAALAGAVAAQSTLKINTPPALTLCEPSLITWEGGAAPYIVSVIPGGQQSAAALKYLSQGTNDHQMTWKIDIEAGTQVTLKVLDNTGLAAFSAPVSIQGTDRSCLEGGNASASASASDAPASESGSASEAPASETPSESESAAPSSSSAEASPSAAAPGSASASPSAAPSPSSATSPSAAVSSVTVSPSAGSSTSSRAPTSTTSKAAASPSASVNSGAKANVASFGVLAAAGALAALF